MAQQDHATDAVAKRNFRLTSVTASSSPVTMTPQTRVVEFTTCTADSTVTLPFSKECVPGSIYSVRLVTYDSSHTVTIDDLSTETKSIAAAVVLNASGECADFMAGPFGWILLRNA